MEKIISPETARQEAEERKKEIEEYVYKVCDKTMKVLSSAIQYAIQDGKTDVNLTTKGYEIDEGGGYVKAFLEQEGYENVLVEETGYSCFDNNRGQTQIVFSF